MGTNFSWSYRQYRAIFKKKESMLEGVAHIGLEREAGSLGLVKD